MTHPVRLVLFALVIILSFDVHSLGIAIGAEELSNQAELVIIGKVVTKTGNKMELNAQPPGETSNRETYFSIMTKYEVEITKIHKGEHADRTINVYSFGGRAGNEVEHWSFGYDFAFGDEVLLFLEKSKANDIWMAVQQSSGAYLLVKRDGYLLPTMKGLAYRRCPRLQTAFIPCLIHNRMVSTLVATVTVKKAINESEPFNSNVC